MQGGNLFCFLFFVCFLEPFSLFLKIMFRMTTSMCMKYLVSVARVEWSGVGNQGGAEGAHLGSWGGLRWGWEFLVMSKAHALDLDRPDSGLD